MAKRPAISKFHGWLVDALTNERIRAATAAEARASRAARKERGVFVLNGRAVRVKAAVPRPSQAAKGRKKG